MNPDRGAGRGAGITPRYGLAAVSCLGLLFSWVSPEIAQGTSSRGELQEGILTLTAGTVVEKTLGGGETHYYQVLLNTDQYFHFAVEQRGIDVIVALHGPAGLGLVEVDSPNGREGVEPLSILAESPGVYQIEIHAPASQEPGNYRALVTALRNATDQDRVRAAAARALALGERLRRQGGRERLSLAVEHYREAHRLWSSLGNQAGQAAALDRIGRTYQRSGELERARAAYEQALDHFVLLGDLRSHAGLLLRLGQIYRRIGDSKSAVATYRKALELSRRAGDRSRQAHSLNNLALVIKSLGKFHQALDAYENALALWRELDETAQQARTLNNIGELYLALGSPQQALDAFLEVLPLRRQVGNRRGEAITLNSLGSAYFKLQQPEHALSAFRRSFRLRQEIGDKRGEAIAQSSLGNAYFHLGQLVRSVEVYEIALARFRAANDLLNEAGTLVNLGRSLERSGRLEEAAEQLQEALKLFGELQDPSGEATAFFGIARIRRLQGDLGAALAASEAALVRIEAIRTEVAGAGLRSTWIANRSDYYELHTDLLMEFHRRQPQAGYDARGFESAQRRRARNLLDSLAGTDRMHPETLSHQSELEELLNAREQDRLRLLRDGAPAPAIGAAERDLRALVAQLGKKTPEIRTAVESLPDLLQIQSRLLDGETALLAYSLGSERSFLWLLTANSINSYVLPGRQEIETLARRAYDLLARDDIRRGRIPAQLATRSLSDLLLAPVADELGEKRLLVVRDGMLHYLPWSVLPDPRHRQGWQPMVERHEIVHLPSAAVLALLENRELKTAVQSVAVLADPVFSLRDPRVCPQSGASNTPCLDGQHKQTSGDLLRLARELGPGGFERLPFSRREAESILNRVSVGQTLSAVGLEASRELVLSGRLAGYRILHFATHGLIHDRHSELSGIVLSLYDGDARPLDGFLRAYEIQRLSLPAELVVLSACRTALGPQVWGEGLVGLPQAFLIAGAQRVLVSLWQVRDQATAELMERFYDRLLTRAQSPAAALRSAQRSMLADSRWEDPQHWAGFLLLGSWR